MKSTKDAGVSWPSRWYCRFCNRRRKGKTLRCKCGARGAWIWYRALVG